MNATRSALAVLALALGTTVFAAGEAAARDPDKETPVRPEVVVYERSADARLDLTQAGASALGGAGVACGVLWVYRRRGRLSSRLL